jgi:hypothetical protein
MNGFAAHTQLLLVALNTCEDGLPREAATGRRYRMLKEIIDVLKQSDCMFLTGPLGWAITWLVLSLTPHC